MNEEIIFKWDREWDRESVGKCIWKVNSSPSDLMSYCSWAKKISRYRESIGELFLGFTLYYRENIGFT